MEKTSELKISIKDIQDKVNTDDTRRKYLPSLKPVSPTIYSIQETP